MRRRRAAKYKSVTMHTTTWRQWRPASIILLLTMSFRFLVNLFGLYSYYFVYVISRSEWVRQWTCNGLTLGVIVVFYLSTASQTALFVFLLAVVRYGEVIDLHSAASSYYSSVTHGCTYFPFMVWSWQCAQTQVLWLVDISSSITCHHFASLYTSTGLYCLVTWAQNVS